MIYILQINEAFKPSSQPFRYPSYSEDFGVEQDFLRFLEENPQLITDNPVRADFHYLPVFWTRWHFNHNFASYGREELQAEVNRVILNETKTFTVCQYDDGPVIDLGQTIQFLASRKTKTGIDIPLLCSPLKIPAVIPGKKYLASFSGSFPTHPIRVEMAGMLQNRSDVLIRDYDGTNAGIDSFINTILESYISLCPRGYGGSSFRFFETMQLGVVPFLIGEPDTRPFKEYLDWPAMSLYSETPYTLQGILDSSSKDDLIEMGKKASVTWQNEITYGRWCQYVIRTLKDLKK